MDESIDYENIDYRSLPPEEQKDLVVQMYVESRIDPDRKPMTQVELAKLFGHSQYWVSKALIDSGVLDRFERRTRSDVVIARAMLQHAAPKVAQETIKSAMKKRAPKYEYITQQDRREVLERAGVRAEKQEATDVNITFTNGVGFSTGMPADVE